MTNSKFQKSAIIKMQKMERCRHEERPRLGSGLRLPCAQYCNIMISLAINNLWDLPKCTKEGGKVCGTGGAQCTLSPESSSKNEAPMLVVGWLPCTRKVIHPAGPSSVGEATFTARWLSEKSRSKISGRISVERERSLGFGPIGLPTAR